MDTEEYKSLKEASDLTGYCYDSLRRAVTRGRIPHQRVWGRIVVRLEDVNTYREHTGGKGGYPKGRPRNQKEEMNREDL